MNKIISTVSAAALLGLGSLAGIAPAAAMPGNFQQQDHYIGNYCDHNPSGGQCNDWRTNHTHWNNSQYHSFYSEHRNDNGFGGDVIAGLFGFAIGAAVVGAVNGSSDHVYACNSRYQSYDRRTDTFLGYDGSRHLCRM